MADFQTKVNIYPAVGVPGAFASVNPIVSTSLGRIAAPMYLSVVSAGMTRAMRAKFCPAVLASL